MRFTDDDKFDRVAVLADLAHHLPNGRQPSQLRALDRLRALKTDERTFPVAIVGEQRNCPDDQPGEPQKPAGEGQHQMERQAPDGQPIVQVRPCDPPVAVEAQLERVLEDRRVRKDARNHQTEHAYAEQTDKVSAPRRRQVQRDVQLLDQMGERRVGLAQQGTGLRVCDPVRMLLFTIGERLVETHHQGRRKLGRAEGQQRVDIASLAPLGVGVL